MGHSSIVPLVHGSIGPVVHWLNVKCLNSIWLNFCRSVPPEFPRSFFFIERKERKQKYSSKYRGALLQITKHVPTWNFQVKEGNPVWSEVHAVLSSLKVISLKQGV